MRCCSNCFDDSEVKGIIVGYKGKRSKIRHGTCDFCGSRNAILYDIEHNQTLSELFNGLIDIYKSEDELPISYPNEKKELLRNEFANRWHIFSDKIDSEQQQRLLITICADRYAARPELFDSPVGIPELVDEEYLEHNSILKTYLWDEFLDGIKTKNRFHSDYINKEVLELFISCAMKKHKKAEVFYRARICNDENLISRKNMGAPPPLKAKSGRVNPTGISVLYLSNTEKTTLYEIRAGIYDYVTIGRFSLQKDIRVIDFANIDRISPFIGENCGLDYTQFAVNYKHLQKIGEEIARPLRNDNTLDYLPTQYISDFIKSKGFDGLEYHSTMFKNGVNLAVFDESLFKCTKVTLYDVKSIDYDYDMVEGQ